MPPRFRSRSLRRRRVVRRGYRLRKRLGFRSRRLSYRRRSRVPRRRKSRYQLHTGRKRTFRSRKSQKRFARKVTTAIVSPAIGNISYGNSAKVPAQTNDGPIPCTYLMSTAGGPGKNETGDRHLNHYTILRTLFNTILPSQYPFGQTGYNNSVSQRVQNGESSSATGGTAAYLDLYSRIKYTIRNQCNEDVYITAYYCKPRYPLQFEYNPPDSHTEGFNTYWWLSQGFYQNGIGTSGTNPTYPDVNVGMTDSSFTPFDSADFTSDFKIMKSKRFKVKPSGEKKLGMSTHFFYEPS